jgi:hypothetical protein
MLFSESAWRLSSAFCNTSCSSSTSIQTIQTELEVQDEMLRKQKTPKEIAMAAQEFGQEDDILVPRVQRAGAERVELAEQPQFAV